MNWIREYEPFINFGLLVGAILYTIITAFILRVSARQLRITVQPALTLKGPPFEDMSTDDQLSVYGNEVRLTNSGNGAAVNVACKIAVHVEKGGDRFPKFNMKLKRVATCISVREDWLLLSPDTAVKTTLGPSGTPNYELLHRYEVFITYTSIVGAKYLTHLSIGQACNIDSFFVGPGSVRRRAAIWCGMLWRFYRDKKAST